MRYKLMRDADRIREKAQAMYVNPALAAKSETFQIRAGDIAKDLGLYGRVQNVCQALRGPKFLIANGLVLEKQEGPLGGAGTRMVYTYRFKSAVSQAESHSVWRGIRGILRDAMQRQGGGEEYLRRERESFESRL